MHKILRDLFTGVDGVTYDIGRLGYALGMVSFLSFYGWSVYQTGKFDGINFGTGIGAIQAAFGLAQNLKKDTEPKCQ